MNREKVATACIAVGGLRPRMSPAVLGPSISDDTRAEGIAD
jgi:hypothetical protein